MAPSPREEDLLPWVEVVRPPARTHTLRSSTQRNAMHATQRVVLKRGNSITDFPSFAPSRVINSAIGPKSCVAQHLIYPPSQQVPEADRIFSRKSDPAAETRQKPEQQPREKRARATNSVTNRSDPLLLSSCSLTVNLANPPLALILDLVLHTLTACRMCHQDRDSTGQLRRHPRPG